MLLRIAFLLFFASSVAASHFRGAYITWSANQTDQNFYPANPYQITAKVHVHFGVSWRRSDGSSYCTNYSIATCQMFNHGSLSIYYGYSNASQPYFYSSYSAGFYCHRYSSTGDFTVGSNRFTLYLPKQYSYKIVTSSCCWVGYLRTYSSSSWHMQGVISLQKHPNFYSRINTPPQIGYLPVIQHYVYEYYYYGTVRDYALPVSDPDGDTIRCRWAANFTEGGGVWNSRLGTLNQNCTLTLSNWYMAYSTGWYALAVMVEDFTYAGWGNYARLSSVPLQFTVQVYNRWGYSRSNIIGDNSSRCGQNKSIIHSVTPPSPSNFTTASPLPTSSPTTQALTTAPTSNGCQSYQVLAHNDRASTYSDWSSYRCDKELYGWYRFMGSAGNRMLNYCPNTYGSAYRCGSYYQGWITSGSLPSVWQGIVTRSVCFSSPGYCSCSYSKSIQMKNCGTFYVYWLNGVPMCNSRYCGVKDNSAKVYCSQNYMRIDLDRNYYNKSMYSSITLRNQACQYTYSYSHISLGSVPGACGSIRKDTTNHIVYENEVILKAKPFNALITRDLDQSIKFSCLFNRNGFVSHLGYRPIYSVNATEKGYGNFSFNFWMYTNRHYSTMHSYYPVTVQLRDVLYFEIQASVSDSNIVLLIDQCYATPTMDRTHQLKYIFINNRCPVDSTTKFSGTVNNKQRFNIQAFRFLQNSTAVYLHCLVFLCHKTSTDARCRYGCNGNNVYRGKRAADEKSENKGSSGTYLLEMELRRLIDKKQDDRKATSKKTHFKEIIAGSVVAVAVALALVILGMALKMQKMKKNAKVCPSGSEDVKASRYAASREGLPPAYEEAAKPSYVDMQQIGVINPSMQDKIFK